jgi:succinate dehydrogenase/fumarate reductase-like Fe-S protein
VTHSKPSKPLSQNSVRLKIWRGTVRDKGEHHKFDITFDEGESVLDGLISLRRDHVPDLAIRFSCFNANVCKECTMLINGEVEYACLSKLHPGTIQIDPLPKGVLLRDLVTDTLSKKEKV